MMGQDNRFFEGQEVAEVHFPAPNDYYWVVGGEIETITVVMEDGQMSGVPWFAIWKNGKIHTKCNGAYVAMVKAAC